MKATIYAEIGRQQMYDLGKNCNLPEKSCHYLSHFNEVELEIEFDHDGFVSSARVIGALGGESVVCKPPLG